MVIAICDDDGIFITNFRNMLKTLAPNDRIITFQSGFALLDGIERGKCRIDLLFLDMQMPHLNGLETAAELRRMHPGLAIIVVTSFPQYALPAYDVFPFHFLTKPIAPAALKACLERVRRRTSDQSLLVQFKDSFVYLPINEIICVERAGVQTRIVTEDRDYRVYQTVDHYEEVLCGKGFYRVSRNAIINLQFVLRVIGDVVGLECACTVQVSRRRKSGLLAALASWGRAYG